jgi:quercetin dioxygenase-like cupin family protein
MAPSQVVIDATAVLGVKVFCEGTPTANVAAEPVRVELEFVPGAQSARHIHPAQEERYEVLSGTLELWIGGRWHMLRAGDALTIPSGTVHAFRNTGPGVVRAVNTHAPGLRFLEYLQVLERLIREGKLTGMRGFRNGIYLSLHAMHYRREVVLVRPPERLIRVMAALGRVLRYRL